MKNKYKKPNPFVYGIFVFLCKIISKFKFKLKIKRNELKGKKGPYIVIANHESAIDFINLAAAVKKRVHFIISYSFYSTVGIRGIMDACGLIPKQQFQTTPLEIKKMKQVISNNMPLAIYPVGLMSENGMSTDPNFATASLLKFLDTDVYVAYTTGSYLTNPKWSKIKRKGQITLDIYKLYDRQELKALSQEEIYANIVEHLRYNDYTEQEKNMIPYKKGNNVEGLEYVLYKCPDCGHEYTVTSNKDTLKCSNCGYEVKADKYGFLNMVKGKKYYKKPSDWFMYIQEDLHQFIENNPDYEFEAHGTVSIVNHKKQKFEVVGDGTATINKNNMTFKGIINNEPVDKTFKTSSYPLLPYSPGRHIELQEGQNIYRVSFDNPFDNGKFILLLKEFNNNKN